MRCVECSAPMPAVIRPGRTPKYCSARCRQRASRARRKSVTWEKLLNRSQGRWVRSMGKRPVGVDGTPASSTDPTTWTSFEAVQGGAGDGFGVMMGDGLGCYDLDKVIVDGRLLPWADDFINSIPEPVLFVEKSMSGTGVHVFIESPECAGTRAGGVERYSRARFIRVTLNELPGEGRLAMQK